MIPKAQILSNLQELNERFLSSRRRKDTLYFSKLAILELCGWIETSLDALMLDISSRKITDAGNRQILEDAVEKTFGFHYHKHFRRLLVQVSGLVTVEKIEARINPVHLAHLQSEFGNLTLMRNSLAHTYMQGSQYTIDAPMVTIARLNRIYPALRDFEKVMRRSIR